MAPTTFGKNGAVSSRRASPPAPPPPSLPVFGQGRRQSPSGLEQTIIEAFMKRADTKSLKKNALIGNGQFGVVILLEGRVSCVTADDDNREVIGTYYHFGDLIADPTVLQLDPREIAETQQIRASTDCRIAQMSKKQWEAFRLEYPAILLLLARQQQYVIRSLEQRLHALAYLDSQERVVRLFRELCSETGLRTDDYGVFIEHKRRDIASMVGCSREAVARVIRQLSKGDFVRTFGRTGTHRTLHISWKLIKGGENVEEEVVNEGRMFA